MSRYGLIGITTVLFALVPECTQAAVIITEVAWMGDGASANHEWIELQNTGTTAVSVDGWTLQDGINLQVELAGSISAGEYAVLERTDDSSAEGAAFLIYTGALVNSGVTLVLKRGDGSIEDQVAGGENWVSIGGDNTTKETAQYTTSGWITAPPTPGKSNVTTASVLKEEPDAAQGEEDETVEKDDDNNSEPATVLRLPGITLDLEVMAKTRAYINQSIDLTVVPSGVGETIQNSLSYDWNFGDGSTENGKEVTHHYRYPGTYVVTVYGHYKRQEYTARHEITVLPVRLSLTRNQNGDLQINNDSSYEVDVSGYTVKGSKVVLFPDRSIILPMQTVTIPARQIGGTATVFDERGTKIVSEAKTAEPSSLQSTAFTPPISPTLTLVPKTIAKEPVISAEEAHASSAEQVSTTLPTTTALVAAATQTATPTAHWPYFGLAGLLLLGLGGVLYRPKNLS